MGGGGYYNRRRNKREIEEEAARRERAGQESAAAFMARVADWDADVQEMKTKCCARCGQPLPTKVRRAAIMYDIGERRLAL